MALDISTGPLRLGGRGGLKIAGASGPAITTSPSAWFKANAITGLSDGGAVATWNDSSGHGRAATQATGSKQPLYKTAILNSLPVVRFDGVDDFMKATNTDAAQPQTYLIVANSSVTGATRVFLSGSLSSHENTIYKDASGNLNLFAGTNVNTTTKAVGTAFHVISAVFNGASSASWVDGAAGPSGNAGAQPRQDIQIGAGAGAAGANFLNGDIAEIVVYNSSLSTADRRAVEAYLGTKYAISVV